MKRVILVLLLLVIAAVAFVSTRPGTFHVERSVTIAAAPEIVFSYVNDFHQWAAWSPWEKLDPNMTKTFGGAESGTGATYHWVGNKDAGEGSMTITASTPDRKVDIKLEFMKPFAATNSTSFTLTPAAGGTGLQWTMDGTNNMMAKAMSVFMSMDKMIGPDFERGLAQLKTVAEAAVAPAAQTAAPADSTK